MRINESSPNPVHVSRGTVCFQCVREDGSVVNEATYNIDDKAIDSVDGITVVNGTLIVTGSENIIFNAISPTQVQCNISLSIKYEVLVYCDCK